MRQLTSLKIGLGSMLSCLALLLGLFATMGTASAASQPNISVSGLSTVNSNCLSFQMTGNGFSHHSYIDLSAQDGSGAAVHLQPGRVRADGNGNFTATVTACGNCAPIGGSPIPCGPNPTSQGACSLPGFQYPNLCNEPMSITFSITARDEHTGSQSNPYQVTYGLSPTVGTPSAASQPNISAFGLSTVKNNCQTFQITGNGFSPNSSVDLSAQDGSGGAVNLQPGRVRADGNGNVTATVTACGNFSPSNCAPTGGSPIPCGPNPTSQGVCAIPFLNFFCTPTPVNSVQSGTFSTPVNSVQSGTFSITARDEHTGSQSNPYQVTYGLSPTVGTPSAASQPNISVSGLSTVKNNCLSFQMIGNGFSPNFSADLSAQDASGGAVNLQPGRVRADGKGNFTAMVTACGTFSPSNCAPTTGGSPIPCGLNPTSQGVCAIPFLNLFCTPTPGNLAQSGTFSITARDEQTGSQSNPYQVTYV